MERRIFDEGEQWWKGVTVRGEKETREIVEK